MKIKVLGSCCSNCAVLLENTKTAVKEMGIEADVAKVDDLKEIVAYGIMSTPALVIDEKVVSYGKVLKPQEIINLIKKLQ